MCIIACKPIGKALPTDEILENMWYGNPDGAGFMYANGGKVRIEKGFMELEDFTKRLDELRDTVDLVNTGMVFHFRIATHGGVRPECTHPFPLTDNIPTMQKLRMTTNVGIAHNGIIHNTPRSKDISDTMEYIASVLSPLSRMRKDFYANKDGMRVVEQTAGSKLAFLTGDGSIYVTSGFMEDDGIMYSNTSYKGWSRYYNTSGKGYAYLGGGWYDLDDYPGYADYRDKDTALTVYEGGKGYNGTDEKDEEEFASYDEWELRQLRSHAVHRYLMDMEEVSEGYVAYPDGTLDPGDDVIYYLDSTNQVWCYDWDADLCFLIEGAKMYDGKGNAAKYKFDLSEPMLCVIS